MTQDYSHLAARIREEFFYRPLTGELMRDKKHPNRKPHGSHRRRYRKVQVGGKRGQHINMHRAVWLWFHGTLPVKPLELDHINQDKHDNRIENLRVVTRGVNARNCHSRKGYCFRSDRPKSPWLARVTVDGVCKRKAFATEEEAKAWVRTIRRLAEDQTEL